ncbi:MAG TPA: tRNA (adenosine(37)-N6)-threonylcarbamoyltransferase complex dimerization subunit type 1 TsaB [Mycobacteriales bacterium]|nr:tRNA (adenosine(37)-N6)-threonylcarbamoyltransferase complex dimerization subunit type 1 TsaB [Mycobacteriales bacterium]
MLTLAFDTSSSVTSVAVLDGADVVAAADHDAPARQGEVLAPAIAALLTTASLTIGDLDRIVVGVGPGPFTGLRVGLMTARSLGHALGIPVIGVVSLDSLAAQVSSGDVVVATDARRKEVYWARYDASGARVEGPLVDRPAELVAQLVAGGFAGRVVGPGFRLYADAFAGFDVVPDVDASAVHLARLAAEGRTTETTSPLYLRRPDAVAAVARKAVLT